MERTALLDRQAGREAAQPGQAKAREELAAAGAEGGMPELTLRQALVLIPCTSSPVWHDAVPRKHWDAPL